MAGSGLAAVVLAAGRGTRFRSERPKVLHAAAGRSLLAHVTLAVATLETERIVVVVGHGAEEVRREVDGLAERLGRPIEAVVQSEQRGTGDALHVALEHLGEGAPERLLVVPGDTPLVTAPTLARLVEHGDGADLVLLSTVLDDPVGYGRVLREGDRVVGIVEHRDATEAERAVTEVNAGMYVGRTGLVRDALTAVDDRNDQGERYLTDVVGHLAAGGATVAAVRAPADEVAGVNDRAQLAAAAAVLRARHLDHLMREVGVSVVDPAATYVDVDVAVGVDAVLLPGTILERGTTVGARATIGPDAHLAACTVGEDAVVHSTRATEAVIGAGAEVGPFAHLRPGTRLGAGARVGAFVQTKNADIGEGAKVPHLAYLGDAEVGAGANVACGVVTANYDGHDKHRTVIGEGAFVGCDVVLVAPVTVGPGAFVAAGSTLTHDVPEDALAVARSRQLVREGWAARRRALWAQRGATSGADPHG